MSSPRIIRTLQLGKSWFPEQAGSGLDRVYYALTQHFERVGVEVHGVVAGSPGVAASSGQRVQSFASDRAPLARRVWALRRMLAGRPALTDIDLVASHFALYTYPVLDLLKDRPLVCHFHGPWAGEGQVEGEGGVKVRLKRALERAVYRRGARFIVLSRAFKQVLHESYGVPDERIDVVPGGVDVSRFKQDVSRREARERLGWPPDRPLLVTVRRLAHRMGLENLVEAVREVRRHVPDVLLHVAGKGPLAETLQARIDALDLRDHVRLLGFVPDEQLPLVYRAADVSVVPTMALEGFGLITVESLAAGTPVLVTPVGGLPEVVEGLSEDLVMPGGTVAAMSRYITAVLNEDTTLPSPEACTDYVVKHFDWPIIAARTRRVYERALE